MLHPVKKLVEVCHRHGVIAVIDGAHAPGQIPLNLPEIDADFYTGKLNALFLLLMVMLIVVVVSCSFYNKHFYNFFNLHWGMDTLSGEIIQPKLFVILL